MRKKSYIFYIALAFITLSFLCVILQRNTSVSKTNVQINEKPALCHKISGKYLGKRNHDPFYIEVKSVTHLKLLNLKYDFGHFDEAFPYIKKEILKKNKVFLILIDGLPSDTHYKLNVISKEKNTLNVELVNTVEGVHRDIGCNGILVAIDKKYTGKTCKLNIKEKPVE